MTAAAEKTGYVVIGRNEGERLKRSLASLASVDGPVIYVDSGSSDGSVEAARSLGARIVCLSADRPFTAARARNEGFRALEEAGPDTQFVMFLDGDCELAPGFVICALEAFAENADYGIVVGRVRERNREASIYNRLCDLEWSGPAGEIDACGGIFLIRRDVFAAVNGFNTAIVAAEDDELCIRVRGQGRRVFRLAVNMCFHDAEMTRFGQWWRRATRAGYAYAQVGATHRGYFRAERARAFFWGLALPAAIIAAAPVTAGWSLLGAGLYAASFVRARGKLIAAGTGKDDAALGATFLVLSKFPNLLGILDFWRKRLSGREIRIVEYK